MRRRFRLLLEKPRQNPGYRDFAPVSGDQEMDIASIKALPEYQQAFGIVQTAFMASLSCLMALVQEVLPFALMRNAVSCMHPFPVIYLCIVYGMRRGLECVAIAALLLFFVTGIQNPVIYVLTTGSVGLALGFGWRYRVGMISSVLFATAVRAYGLFGCFQFASMFLGENVFQQFANIAQQLATAFGIKSSFTMQDFLRSLIWWMSFWHIIFVHIACFWIVDRLFKKKKESRWLPATPAEMTPSLPSAAPAVPPTL
eukprot:tig00000144_g8995.t1